uniref:Uncharacterized protein n=1 Tax=Calcidiscus leptoporus TaxID=127549 RepID=A0A7S0JJE5_9EUKA|eukprot:CAMPEP_0119376522 /NCGR_PEP_ID=MMETSP1334-20130426/40121_1 /TAXON_ID=127549 /ORGANISM="Calcidiscus leptoporus, Strain RCC1130" /LENGTH=352 /DNA_ID=CAMNT_0007395091 /DNA_START=1 /DNA_END=1059 /DNA_ORIENTATION=-
MGLGEQVPFPPACTPARDHAGNVEALFTSLLILSAVAATIAMLGCMPPNPSVHWPGHSWIHFMKRLHVIMSIGCFLIEFSACFFAIFALHRTLAGGFDTRAASTVELLMRELEFEFVAVTSYFFAGTMLLMGPVGIRCFCMVQQGLRSDTLAASVMCLIVGVVLLILSFFNAHLQHFPFDSYEEVLGRFVALSFRRCVMGGTPATITLLAWLLQSVSLALAVCSLVETLPWYYYREYYYKDEAMGEADGEAVSAAAEAEEEATRPPRVAEQRSRHESYDSTEPEADKPPTPAERAGGQQPWQLALTDPRLGPPTTPMQPRLSPMQRPAKPTGLPRSSSLTSSIYSLDSLVVD